MPTPLEKAREFLEKLEADRRNALQVSEQKAEEAMLINEVDPDRETAGSAS